ncbi:cytochrome aa3 quinol oxidase subunit IV [Ectobacillus ponti]|uniref:Quinol oxidase subunit 4 n=1 Tax=Ectobacillus ponti TaxID=2961894 RepID=A0AA41X6G7_9BACI|nr:cytochrome aa3 quinol oxidase subunit IV [Ectobacillus ponti]MCP8969592.1 cytochrome aa3 quinol oxidase subunit IV [Ectobacillus ponti]
MAQHNAQATHHKGFPWSHVFGFIMSLVLTFAALYIALYTTIPFGTIMTVIVIMAVIQAVLQLVMFMHLSEGEGVIQKVAILYSFFIAAVTVIGTVWIFFTM